MNHHRTLSAVYTATSVQIDCPDCGESLPAPCGSLFWTIDELSGAIAESPNRTCDSCDGSFVLRQQNKAHLSLATYLPPLAEVSP